MKPTAANLNRHGARLGIVLAALLFLAVTAGALLEVTHQVVVYRVASSSMQPVLRCAGAPGCSSFTADSIVVSDVPYWFSRVRRGDIVVFHAPGGRGVIVKRVIGLPEEYVSERAGYIYIDGRRLREPYVRRASRDRGSFRSRQIPRGDYFVLGDNRRRSVDSRSYGCIARRTIVGLVIARYGSGHGLSRL